MTDCKKCKSKNVWRNGRDAAGNQKFLCRACGYVWTDYGTIKQKVK